MWILVSIAEGGIEQLNYCNTLWLNYITNLACYLWACFLRWWVDVMKNFNLKQQNVGKCQWDGRILGFWSAYIWFKDSYLWGVFRKFAQPTSGIKEWKWECLSTIKFIHLREEDTFRKVMTWSKWKGFP